MRRERRRRERRRGKSVVIEILIVLEIVVVVVADGILRRQIKTIFIKFFVDAIVQFLCAVIGNAVLQIVLPKNGLNGGVRRSCRIAADADAVVDAVDDAVDDAVIPS